MSAGRIGATLPTETAARFGFFMSVQLSHAGISCANYIPAIEKTGVSCYNRATWTGKFLKMKET